MEGGWAVIGVFGYFSVDISNFSKLFTHIIDNNIPY